MDYLDLIDVTSITGDCYEDKLIKKENIESEEENYEYDSKR